MSQRVIFMPFHSFVMPIQGVEAGFANGRVIALLFITSSTRAFFEFLRISQCS
ncbi:hypothetical protein J7E55_27380 [Bacillus sp. ISL-53]|nr:hypothetical protein [Bacillus sp. ISL-53]